MRGQRRGREQDAKGPTGTEDRASMPAPPFEVAGPLGKAATVSYVAARAPLLAVSSLRGADCVDDTAVKFLLRAELTRAELRRKKEEVKKQELADEALDDKLDAEFDELMAIGPERLTSRQGAWLRAIQQERRAVRKSKKRRKKFPRTRRLPRQWHVRYAGLAGCDTPCVVFFSVVDQPEMLSIMASMSQKDSSALFVDSGSGMCKVGFAGCYGPRFLKSVQ